MAYFDRRRPFIGKQMWQVLAFFSSYSSVGSNIDAYNQSNTVCQMGYGLARTLHGGSKWTTLCNSSFWLLYQVGRGWGTKEHQNIWCEGFHLEKYHHLLWSSLIDCLWLGLQFETPKLKEWLAEHDISRCFSYVGHPQANGQVEAFNKIISEGVKKKLDEAKSLWADELPNFLWSIRTTTKNSAGETPFLLTYGA